MVHYTAVPGTWAWPKRHKSDAWFNETSAFAQFASTHGLAPLRSEGFFWSTDIGGAQAWRRWFGKGAGDHNDWEAGGLALRWYLEPFLAPHRALIAHSHGGQVALYAAASGLKIPVLVTVATPIRHDMESVITQARPNIGYWLHIYASVGGDWIQWLGAFGDGWFSTSRTQPFADVNHGVPYIRHGRVLEDPALLPLWESNGWLDLISSKAQIYVG